MPGPPSFLNTDDMLHEARAVRTRNDQTDGKHADSTKPKLIDTTAGKPKDMTEPNHREIAGEKPKELSVANRFFQALADPTRLRALMLMMAEGEVCVCEITHALGESQPKISRHLAYLRSEGYISDRRDAQWIYYSLHPELPAWQKEILLTCQRELAAQDPFRDDRARLARLVDRRPRRCAA